jgi:hypothetical protein
MAGTFARFTTRRLISIGIFCARKSRRADKLCYDSFNAMLLLVMAGIVLE